MTSRAEHDPFSPQAASDVPSPVASAADVDVTELTVDEALAWVGDDKRRARSALRAERRQDTPRKTLVEALESVIG